MSTISDVTSNNLTCAICLEELIPEDKVSKLNCNHEYHQTCLEHWRAVDDTCPLDRGKITSINGVATQPSNEDDIRTDQLRFLYVYFLSRFALSNGSALSNDSDPL